MPRASPRDGTWHRWDVDVGRRRRRWSRRSGGLSGKTGRQPGAGGVVDGIMDSEDIEPGSGGGITETSTTTSSGGGAIDSTDCASSSTASSSRMARLGTALPDAAAAVQVAASSCARSRSNSRHDHRARRQGGQGTSPTATTVAAVAVADASSCSSAARSRTTGHVDRDAWRRRRGRRCRGRSAWYRRDDVRGNLDDAPCPTDRSVPSKRSSDRRACRNALDEIGQRERLREEGGARSRGQDRGAVERVARHEQHAHVRGDPSIAFISSTPESCGIHVGSP